MGLLVDGVWHDDDPRTVDASGAFVRKDSSFRSWITADGASGFAAEAGRYHLFTAPSCPWAHRTEIFRVLKGLTGAVSHSVADGPGTQGWVYSSGFEGIVPEGGQMFLHQVYTAADPHYTGRVTVPTLWDRKTRTIVNNESSEIIRMLNGPMAAFGNSAIDYYPEPLRAEIDAVNDRVYRAINNGVYRCGFAHSQEAYDTAVRELFAALDEMEARLARGRYLTGPRITEADWRLFPTLVRFDLVYYGHFKCNLRQIRDYPNLNGFLRELFAVPGIAGTVNIEGIRRGYYGGQRQVNPTGIVPIGPTVDFTAPHDRGRLPAER